MKKNRLPTLVICEGGKREPDLLKSMCSCFSLLHDNKRVLQFDYLFSNNSSIYDFYNKLKDSAGCDENLERDIDILKFVKGLLQRKPKNLLSNDDKQILNIDRVGEIYLFFDLDIQNANFNYVENFNIVEELLNFFDDAATRGKLYISYPMVEALKDICKHNSCDIRCCTTEAVLRNGYKDDVANTQLNFQDSRKYDLSTWQFFCAHAMRKANCLINGKYEDCEYRKEYKNETTYPFGQMALFAKERLIIEQKKKIYVLSGLPLFLIEFFGENKWNDWNPPKDFQLQAVKECRNK